MAHKEPSNTLCIPCGPKIHSFVYIFSAPNQDSLSFKAYFPASALKSGDEDVKASVKT